MKIRLFHSAFTVVLGGMLTLVALWPGAITPVWANPDIRYVAETGSDISNDCKTSITPCTTIQHAIDVATPGDEIYVAEGNYGSGGTVAVITKELTIQGAHASDFSSFDPDQYQTVLDAQNGGSVISITNAGGVYLQHLTLTHGDGSGNCAYGGCGGGIYASGTNLYVSQCVITNNVGGRTGGALGGGIYAYAPGQIVEIWESQIVSNTAAISALLSSQYGHGGGVYIQEGDVSLRNNEVLDNVGAVYYSGSGGIKLEVVSSAEVLSNTIRGNKATLDDYWASGGGIYVSDSSSVYVAGNHIESNQAGYTAGYGGGVYVVNSDAHVTRNTIIDNTTGTMNGYGGGVCVLSATPVTVSNNIIAQNYAGSQGGGVSAIKYGAPASEVLLVNNTIIDNGGTGVVASQYARVDLKNNIIAGHTIGLSEDPNSPVDVTISADTNLFWNTSDPTLGANAIVGDPLLTADYHLRDNSPAIDTGLTIPWLVVDFAGTARPQRNGYDIGTFEEKWKVYLPLILQA